MASAFFRKSGSDLMLKRNVFNLFSLALYVSLAACSKPTVSGPVEVTLIRPTAEHCKYTIAPTTIQTLDNLYEMRGKVGRVVTSSKQLDSTQILENGTGYDLLDVQFNKSGNTYGPVDTTSLFAASLYYAIETGYQLFKTLDPKADMQTLLPGMADTLIFQDVKRSDDQSKDSQIYDNAEYLPYQLQNGNAYQIRNYFFAYPTKSVTQIPLGLNLGVMVHEYTHMVFQHLFYQPGIRRNMGVSNQPGKPTENTLAALDEGLADYFGFMAVKDPGYFLCSFPSENRDLRVPKEFTDPISAAIESPGDSFDPHEGGAVFAAIQYQIGEALKSHEANAKAIIGMMSSLLDCTDVNLGNNTLAMSFASVARCHEKQFSDSSRSSVVHQIYQQYLGNKYRGQ